MKQEEGRPAEPYNRFVVRPIVLTCLAAVAVFAVVQDRITGAGVGQYLAMYREAVAGGRTPVSIDDVMQPAVERGVRQGAFWGGAVLIAGVAGTLTVRRRAHRG